jgi:putative sugar O-methyltransferase
MIILKKIKKAYEEKNLIKKINNFIRPYYQGFIIALLNLYPKNISIHSPAVKKNNIEDLSLAKRIFESFKKMKQDQKNTKEIFKPSTLWQDHLDNDHYEIYDSLKNNDVEKFLYYLSNFGNWHKDLGIEHNTYLQRYNKNFFSRKYLLKNVYGNLLDIWKYFENNYNDTNSLRQPSHGNQIGAFVNKDFVTIGSFFSDIISTNLSRLIEKKEKPVVAEVGGGYGKLAYYLNKRLKKSTYIDFDLPETLCLAAFFLMKSWPEKKVMLYGEETFSDNIIKDFDLIFLPNFEIEKLRENSIDLFLNKNSLGEMKPNTVHKYIEHISYSTNYFFHMNHEKIRNNFDDGTQSLLNNEYLLPEDKFDLIFRQADLGHIIYRGEFEINSDIDDIFMYLFKKK